LAERFLEKHNFTALSAGHIFVGRPEDYARFEAVLRDRLVALAAPLDVAGDRS